MEFGEWWTRGTKVRFLGKNGYKYQLEEAKKLMDIGAILDVESSETFSSSSIVSFKQFPGKKFNTVMFEVVMIPSDEQKIREIAYSLWEKEGRPEGMAERHWNDAKALYFHPLIGAKGLVNV